MYVVLQAVYPALCCLRYCDSNTQAIDKIYRLAYRTRLAIKQSVQSLEDINLFAPFANDVIGLDLRNEEAQIYGEDTNGVIDW